MQRPVQIVLLVATAVLFGVAGFLGGYLPQAASHSDTSEKLSAAAKTNGDLKKELDDSDKNLREAQAAVADLTMEADAQSARVQDLEAFIQKVGAGRVAPSTIRASIEEGEEYESFVDVTVDGDMVEVSTTLQDPRGADGSSEANEAISICKIVHEVAPKLKIRILESDGTIFVNGPPCKEQ